MLDFDKANHNLHGHKGRNEATSTLDVVIAVTAILAAFGIFSLADSYVHPAENQPQYQYHLTPPDGYADFPLSAKYIKVLDPGIGKFSAVMAQDKYGEVHYYTSTREGYAIIEKLCLTKC